MANPRTLKKSKSMSNLKLLGAISALSAVVLANESAGMFTNADAWYKGKFSIANAARHIFVDDNMTPEEKHALAKKILEVINTFDIQKIGKLELPEYKECQLKDVNAQEEHIRKYWKSVDDAIKKIKDEYGHSYTDRVDVKKYDYVKKDVKKYEIDVVQDGAKPLYDRYRSLYLLNRSNDLGVLNDLTSWDFKK